MLDVVLVGPEIEENLALRYLTASLAAAGWTSTILPFNVGPDLNRVVATILLDPPRVVGLSLAFQWRAQDFLALAVALRDAGYQGHITAGGHFGTFAARDILTEFPEIDTICRQEAEETLVKLVAAITGSDDLRSIPGLALRDDAGQVLLTADPPLPDLGRLPRPDRRGLPASCLGHAIAPLVGSRGCYANCSFCCIAAWHEQSLPGRRYRVREPDDIASEMVEMQRARGIEIFVFHDDNFFLPRREANLQRFHALADALQRHGIGRFATVVKARPTDVDLEVFRVLVERLHNIRVYVGIETDADRGLKTLQRWAHSRHNHAALDVVESLDLYTCSNLLLFDPDTTLDDLETNIAFMERSAVNPFNFGRVELYAGTPLLRRMQLEGRAKGDWLQWDYDLASPEVTRVFRMAMTAFYPRNFDQGALHNHIMGTRFDLEVARKFHPDLFDPAWLQEGKELSRLLGADSARAMRALVQHVRTGPAAQDAALAAQIGLGLREVEAEVRRRMQALARQLQEVIGGVPLTDLEQDAATPLQAARSLVSGETFIPGAA